MPPRRWCRTALATFVWFFALAASAHAECAWVLWVGLKLGPTMDSMQWMPMRSDSNEAACQRSAAENGAKIVPGIMWVCLPDTVDPRGPKGK